MWTETKFVYFNTFACQCHLFSTEERKTFFEYVDNAISGYKDENCVDPSATSSSTTSLSSTSTSTSTIAKLEVVNINTFQCKRIKNSGYFQQNVNTVTAVDCDAIVCAIECRNSETCIAWTLSPHHSLIAGMCGCNMYQSVGTSFVDDNDYISGYKDESCPDTITSSTTSQATVFTSTMLTPGSTSTTTDPPLSVLSVTTTVPMLLSLPLLH